MRTTMLLLGGMAMLGIAGCSQGMMGSGGVPSAAAGGTSGSGPAEIRNSPADSPVGTGSGGGSPGGAGGGVGTAGGSSGSPGGPASSGK